LPLALTNDQRPLLRYPYITVTPERLVTLTSRYNSYSRQGVIINSKSSGGRNLI
jgi:hypothetical protein